MTQPQNRMVGRNGADTVNTARVREGEAPMEKSRAPKRPAKRQTVPERAANRAQQLDVTDA